MIVTNMLQTLPTQDSLFHLTGHSPSFPVSQNRNVKMVERTRGAASQVRGRVAESQGSSDHGLNMTIFTEAKSPEKRCLT